MMLPHGFEGQGPEHSSARLERFLQLCAEHNMQICNPTTPAQIFHLLRRQAIRPMRRPLVIMSPKWILRHKLATSSLEQLATEAFHNVIGDGAVDAAAAKRVVLCSGKVYYHLLEEREERGIDDIALVRIEQLYPFPDRELEEVLKGYANVQDIIWCQEEPMNQGAWYSSQHHMRNAMKSEHPQLNLSYVGRDSSASPAAGYMSVHLEEQSKFINEALSFDV
jgi:2-oxoglutarate dehydrogenase E1 component